MIEKIDTGTHVALVDAVAGAGVLVAPGREGDAVMPGVWTEAPGVGEVITNGSLQSAGGDNIVRRLYGEGWEFCTDDEDGGERIPLAHGPGGATAYALWPTRLNSKQMSNNQFDQAYAEWETYVRALLAHFGEGWRPCEG